LSEIRNLVEQESQCNPNTRRIFLADGDVMRQPFNNLVEILTLLNQHFPRLARVSLYASGSAIASKSAEQLRILHSLKLHTLYMGLESGDDQILKNCKKGETATKMVEAGLKAQESGLRMSVMILLGLGGSDNTQEHAINTAKALNLMQPRLLSALRVIPVKSTELYDDVAAGRFKMLSEHGVVKELRNIIGDLDMQSTVFRANHGSNVIPLEGRLPRDKERLLAELDTLIDSERLDKYSPGSMPRWL
jgi:radical SAM superfamily enzyme YgiQ (UPF0313 family)